MNGTFSAFSFLRPALCTVLTHILCPEEITKQLNAKRENLIKKSRNFSFIVINFIAFANFILCRWFRLIRTLSFIKMDFFWMHPRFAFTFYWLSGFRYGLVGIYSGLWNIRTAQVSLSFPN